MDVDSQTLKRRSVEKENVRTKSSKRSKDETVDVREKGLNHSSEDKHSRMNGYERNTKSEESKSIAEPNKTSLNIGEEAPVDMLESPNGEDLTELVALQRKIMGTKDPMVLVNVVSLIQKAGKYKIGETTFDFDLCTLDSDTIQQIRLFVSEKM